MSNASKGKYLAAVLSKLHLVLVLFCALLVSISSFVPVLVNHQFASGASTTTASSPAPSSPIHPLPHTPILSPNATTPLQGKVIRVPLYAKINATALKKPLHLPGPVHEVPDTFAPPPFALPPKEQVVKPPTKVITLRPANTTTTTTTSTKTETNTTSSISSGKSNHTSSSLPLPSSRLDPIQFTGIKGIKECQVGRCITPPDFGLAAGRGYVVQLVNNEGEIINPPPVNNLGSVASPLPPSTTTKSFAKPGIIPGNCQIVVFCPVRVFDLNSFFGVSPLTHSIGDPEIIFDPQSDKWFASVFDQSTNLTTGKVTAENSLVAVSTSNNPNSTWNIYRFPTSNTDFPDQPAIGVSGDKFIISTNNYVPNSPPPGMFRGVEFLVAMKQDMIAGANPLQMYDSGERQGEFGMIPIHDASPICINSTVHSCGNNLYMASNFLNNAMALKNVYGKLPHIRVSSMDPYGIATDPLGNTPPCPMPQVTSLPSVSETHRIADQKGTDTKIDVTDTRLHYGGMPFITSYTVTTPAFRNILQSGMAFTEGCTPDGDNKTRSCIRLFAPGQITSHTVEPGTLERRYECGQPEVNLDIAGPPGTYLFSPSLSVDSAGNWDIIFGYSSSNDYPRLGFTVLPRTGISCHAIPTSIFPKCVAVMAAAPEPFITLISGTAPDTTGRHGDYSQTTTDPSDPSFVYAGGEIFENTTAGSWSTFIAHARGP